MPAVFHRSRSPGACTELFGHERAGNTRRTAPAAAPANSGNYRALLASMCDQALLLLLQPLRCQLQLCPRIKSCVKKPMPLLSRNLERFVKPPCNREKSYFASFRDLMRSLMKMRQILSQCVPPAGIFKALPTINVFR